ncbi:type II toxin-antitoxin system RelE/ParE family toxin [Salinarimonas sp.]|uniref:type II toxin-antitoxin system RelE/ParE family toxin n=1 Tax=Salinarimonas sp. TaxID=2766526 RepID=UPI0039192148
MRLFKNKWFVRFARREAIADVELCNAIARAERGLVDADLGGGVIKQRISRPNEGKSGGFRAIVLFRSGDRSFFVYGFPKHARENIRNDEVEAFKKLASEMLSFCEEELQKAIGAGLLMEVK